MIGIRYTVSDMCSVQPFTIFALNMFLDDVMNNRNNKNPTKQYHKMLRMSVS